MRTTLALLLLIFLAGCTATTQTFDTPTQAAQAYWSCVEEQDASCMNSVNTACTSRGECAALTSDINALMRLTRGPDSLKADSFAYEVIEQEETSATIHALNPPDSDWPITMELELTDGWKVTNAAIS